MLLVWAMRKQPKDVRKVEGHWSTSVSLERNEVRRENTEMRQSRNGYEK